MLYSLYYKNHKAMQFDFEESFIEVIDNKYLPYALKDYIKTTGQKDFSGSIRDINVLRDYLASRTLNLYRENAKTILNVAALPQSLNTEQRLKIVMACNGLSMQDSFWLKKEDDTRSFDEVCLRNHKLSEASYDIAILGKHVSATADELIPDLTTEGMFPKYWHRTPHGRIELWKTDKMGGTVNSKCEVEASRILDSTDYPHVSYRQEVKAGKVFSVCECMADDTYSFIPMQDIMDWHVHTGKVFPEGISDIYKKSFPDMCVIDYVLANTDRHSGNWGVMTDDNNQIIGFAPMFDMNQALVSDMIGTDISTLIYEPTVLTYLESVKKWAPYSTIDWSNISGLSDKIQSRVNYVEDCKHPVKSKDRTVVDDPLIKEIADKDKENQQGLNNSDRILGDE